jgi:hypothetical protein
VSAHPLTTYRDFLRKKASHSSVQLGGVKNRDSVTVAGLVSRFRKHLTKTGNDMGFVTLEDLFGSMDLVVFPNVWKATRELIQTDNILIVDGKVDNAGGDPKILVDAIRVPTPEELTEGMDQSQVSEVTAEPGKVDISYRYDIEFGGADFQGEESADDQESEDHYDLNDFTMNDNFEDDLDPFFDPFFMENREYEIESETNNLPIETPDEEPHSVDEVVAEKKEEIVLVEDEGSHRTGIDRQEIREEPGENQQQGRLFKPASAPVVQENKLEKSTSTQKSNVVIPSADHVLLLRKPGKDEYRMLTVVLRSNFNEEDRGMMRMKRVLGLLRSYPGNDKFGLMIFENGKRVDIEFPNDTTGYCPELMRRLKDMVGEDNIQIKVFKVL